MKYGGYVMALLTQPVQRTHKHHYYVSYHLYTKTSQWACGISSRGVWQWVYVYMFTG